MGKWILVMLIGATMLSSPCEIFAQEEDIEYVYGTVITVNEAKNEIVVSEQDWESETEVTVTYSIAPTAELEGVESITEIKPDMSVEIEFITDKSGKKVAKSVGVYE